MLLSKDTQDDAIFVLNFYSFTDVGKLKEFNNLFVLKSYLISILKSLDLLGSILIADEGVNGAVSGKKESITKILHIVKDIWTLNLNTKISSTARHPFEKRKVKIKKEIVSLGVSSLNINENKGEYIYSGQWDDFINNEEVLLVDTRNNYECYEGSFVNAINPNTATFKEFPNWVKNNSDMFKNKKIAMFCTGGIRCEKATAYLKVNGYNNVYHLYGGILQYLEDTKNEKRSWHGSCFVFDNRYALNDDLEPDS